MAGCGCLYRHPLSNPKGTRITIWGKRIGIPRYSGSRGEHEGFGAWERTANTQGLYLRRLETVLATFAIRSGKVGTGVMSTLLHEIVAIEKEIGPQPP